MTQNIVEEELDLSDIDLLDDPRNHAFCPVCSKAREAKLLDRVEALCGVEIIKTNNPRPRPTRPNDMCIDCLSVIKTTGCAHCGYTRTDY